MATMNNPLIHNAGQIASSDNASIVDISLGGQLGLGANLINIDAATPQVLMHVFAVVTHVPTMLQKVPGAAKVLRGLVERSAKEISGIDFQREMEFGETPIGHSGQMLEMPTAAKLSRVTPTFVWPEFKGMLVWNFMGFWMDLMKHYDTQASNLASINGGDVDPQLLSAMAMDIMILQFDTDLRPENLLDAYQIIGMMPKEQSLAGFKKTIGQSEIPERSIPFTGILQYNRNTKLAGQAVARALSMHSVDYRYATPVAQRLNPQTSGEGLEKEVAQASTFRPLG